jgi:TetR/AcrR family transcriptional regulator of autoinduction and epiphytic fitness
MARGSFRDQVLKVREDAIVSSVNRLLAEKGFEQMTVDEVAADVGIAKASLYKHFASKEALAAAAMVRVLERTMDVLEQQAARDTGAVDRLREVTRWALRVQLAGEMPLLPSQNSSLRAELLGHQAYLALLMQVSARLGEWIVQAQGDGDLDRSLPPELVLYTLFARACDPVPGAMKASGRHSNDQIVEWVLAVCFSGIGSRPS